MQKLITAQSKRNRLQMLRTRATLWKEDTALTETCPLSPAGHKAGSAWITLWRARFTYSGYPVVTVPTGFSAT